MTGTIIKVPGVNARPNNIGWYPDGFPMAGLEYAGLYGGTLAQSLKNLAPGKPDATVVGAPAVGANTLTMKHLVNYLQTSVAETDDMTLLVVRATAQVTNAFDIGNDATIQRTGGIYPAGFGLRTSPFGSSPVSATQNYFTARAGYFSGVSGAAGSVVQAVSDLTTEPGTDSCLALAGRINAAGVLTWNDLTRGTVKTATIPGGNVRDKAGLMRIGSGGLADPSRADDLPLVAAFIWSLNQTDGGLAGALAWTRGYCARRSLVV